MRTSIRPILSLYLGLSMVVSTLIALPPMTVQANNLDGVYSLTDNISVPNGNKKVSIEATNEDIRQVLHSLADEAGFNLMMDDSISGMISIELNQVTVNEALKSLSSIGNLEIVKKSGNIYLAVSKEVAKDKGLDRLFSKVIKVNYSNANRIAAILNTTIFAPPEGQQAALQADQKVRADSRTNSLILVGTGAEIELAEKAIVDLDVPRQSKTFYLSNANALQVASVLSSGVFNDGTGALGLTGGGSSSSSVGGGAGGAGGIMVPSQASQMNVENEKIQEGSGIYTFGGSGGSAATAGLGQSITLRGTVKENITVSVSPNGPLIIPDTRTNSVTIMGTAEQIAMAESVIPVIDAQIPQVSIEASLVEITETGTKDLANGYGLGQGRWQFGFNNEARTFADALSGIATVNGQDRASAIGYTSNPVTRSKQFTMQIRALIEQRKAKIIANPTVVATHDHESVINIVDEIIRRTTVEQSANGGSTLTTQRVEIGEVGIVLDILPKIGEDGTISMRLRPSVSSIRDNTQTDAFGNAVTLLSKRDFLAQSVRMQDGETLVVGGLIRQEDTLTTQKLPGAGDLPIVGAMFRASRKGSGRSEIVLMITPHILNNTNLVPVNYTQTNLGQASGFGGGQ